MFITFPPIPTPNLPKIALPSGVQTGKSSSSSKVIVCVNDKCLTQEQNSTGSSYLKVTTQTHDGATTSTIESSGSGNQIVSEVANSEPIKEVLKNEVFQKAGEILNSVVNYLRSFFK